MIRFNSTIGEELLGSPIILTVQTIIPRQNQKCSKKCLSITITITSECR